MVVGILDIITVCQKIVNEYKIGFLNIYVSQPPKIDAWGRNDRCFLDRRWLERRRNDRLDSSSSRTRRFEAAGVCVRNQCSEDEQSDSLNILFIKYY